MSAVLQCNSLCVGLHLLLVLSTVPGDGCSFCGSLAQGHPCPFHQFPCSNWGYTMCRKGNGLPAFHSTCPLCYSFCSGTFLPPDCPSFQAQSNPTYSRVNPAGAAGIFGGLCCPRGAAPAAGAEYGTGRLAGKCCGWHPSVFNSRVPVQTGVVVAVTRGLCWSCDALTRAGDSVEFGQCWDQMSY